MPYSDVMEKLLWLDLEMTGLDIEKEVIIETGAIVTDWDFKRLDEYHAVVKQPQAFLDRMDDWNKKHHGESGLTALVPNGKDSDVVEQDLIRLIDQHFGKDPAVLAGNSIFQDRIFVNKYWPKLSTRLHYRMLDVTSWKIVMQTKFGVKVNKNNTHRAVDDIQESINELATYLKYVRKD